MRKWLGEIVRIITVIVFMFVIALTTRMSAFLAVPAMILSYFVYALVIVWSERFDDDWY